MPNSNVSDESSPAVFKRFRTPWVGHKAQRVLLAASFAQSCVFMALGGMISLVFVRLTTLQIEGWGLFSWTDTILLVLVCLFIVASIWVMLVISNRVVGPIFKLVRQMESLANDNKLDDLKLRKNDEFLEVAEAYNKIVARIRRLEGKA